MLQSRTLFIILSFVIFLLSSVPLLAQQFPQNNTENKASLDGRNVSSLFTNKGFISTPWSASDNVVNTTPITKKKSFFQAKKDEIIETLTSLHYKYAMMMNVNVEHLKNLKLLSFIEDWWGTHYRLGGNSKKGIDCSALMDKLADNVYGIELPRTAHEQYEASTRVDREDLKEGDLVFFGTSNRISHVGMYLENGYFVHASSSKGVMISNLDESYFAKKYAGAGRL